MQILAFGDSITWGSWDEEGGWADRLKCYFYARIKNDPDEWTEVYNLGIPGNRTDHLLQRFSGETNQRVSDEEPTVFLFAFGANDAAFNTEQNEFAVSPEDFLKNLQQVVQEAKKLSPHVFLLSITPVDESSPQKNALKVRKNEYVRLYNEQIKKIVEEEKVGLIDANQAFLESTTQLLCEDGLHPNAEGHRILFELVKGHIPFLQENS